MEEKLNNNGQLDDSYWNQTATSSFSFKSQEEEISRQNNLWDGLFSPALGPANIFELHDDFKKQLSISPTEITENGNSMENCTQETSEDINACSSSTPTPSEPCVSTKNNASSNGKLSKSPPNGSSPRLSNATFMVSSNSSCTIESASNSHSDSQHTTASDMTVHLDYARLKAEHRKLKRYYENAYANRYKTPPISEIIQRLARCEPVALDFYRSRKEKMDLLDAALELDNWDVVVTIVLFIKRTLDNTLFRQCLLEKPAAAQHYVAYLQEANEKQELADTLLGLGRIADATMLDFEQICRIKDAKKQLEALKNCLISGFHHPDLLDQKPHLEEWIGLLETHAKPHSGR